MEAHAVALSRWRPTPLRLLKLLGGLSVFGAGEGLIVASELGNSPWTVLAEGVSEHTPLAVGSATVAISFLVLALWIPLRQRPGLGTLLNAIVIGLGIDATLAVLPALEDPAARGVALAAGIGMVALGSGLYLTTALGPGPRDGLMTALHRRTGLSVRLVRSGLELGALISGFMLGGTVGIGTVAFAVAIGPAVQAVLPWFGDRPAAEL